MRQRPTLPGRLQPSTIGVLRLNFCVRNGNRWNPQAITTAIGEQCRPPHGFAASRVRCCTGLRPLSHLVKHFVFYLLVRAFAPGRFPCILTTAYELYSRSILSSFPIGLSDGGYSPNRLNQAIDLLVSSSCIHYCTSTDDLSTW